MSVSSSSRPFAQPNYPTSPAPTTASSLNYSQYGSTSFAGGAGGRNPSVSSSSYGAPRPQPSRNGSSALRVPNSAPPPGGGGDRKPESRDVARVHWRALKEYLASWLEKESPTSRASAREKLTRLTKLQFQELSTDVYDELMRRQAAQEGQGDVPFLPVREDFHPKRNQARQKLATLPQNRFKDLASDVFFELKRRYPEFAEIEEDERAYDEPPPAPGPQPIRPTFAQNPSQASMRSDRDGRGNPTPPPVNRLGASSSASRHQRQESRGMSQSSSVGSLSQQRPSIDRDFSRQHSGSGSRDYGQAPNLTGTTSEMVVPNKSRMREEDIEVPYARDSQVLDTSRMSSRAGSVSSAGRNQRPDSRGSFEELAPRSRTPVGRPQPPPSDVLSPSAVTDDREYYDRMSFSSNVTNKSKLAVAGQANTGWDEEREQKIRAEYEFRIAGLERRLNQAETEREEAKRQEAQERDRRKEWEDEVRGLKERAATHASSLRSVQHELDLARDATEAARNHSEESGRAAQEEIAQWRDRCDGLEDELRRLEDEKAVLEANQGGGGGGGEGSEQMVMELKREIHGLVDELNTLSARNDELVAEREEDAERMAEMEGKVDEYKRRYDAVRIELRNLKATSTMFVSKPLTDDHLPASADGNIADVNVSSFQTAIDGLLQAGRSSQPSGVLPAMKAVVEAVTEIGQDVKAFEEKPNLDVDASKLESLKHESTTRLNTLMQAARNHAMASGLSPVSLLDAAAGHLTANVVEIIKLLKIRRSEKNREMRRSRSSMSIKDMVNRAPGQEIRSPSRSMQANGAFDKEYGREEHLRESPVVIRRPSDELPLAQGRFTPSGDRSRTTTPVDISSAQNANGQLSTRGGPGGSGFRINSFQSASSHGRQSDAFDLERKASVASDRDRQMPSRPMVESRNNLPPSRLESRSDSRNGSNGDRFAYGHVTTGAATSPTTASSPVGPPTAYGGQNDYVFARDQEDEPEDDVGLDDGQEWEDLKPYLNTQSSLLVNSIQNLLAAIRTGSSSPALNEHLSEVIAIASSIVAVSTNALPSALRGEGDILLKDLVNNTNRLSEAQEVAKKGSFEKEVRQGIASASFGVAKSLKALMKLGAE